MKLDTVTHPDRIGVDMYVSTPISFHGYVLGYKWLPCHGRSQVRDLLS